MSDASVERLRDRKSTVDLVYEILKDRIRSSAYPMGSDLNQLILAKEFEVSRTVVREALRKLEAEHLVELKQNHRTVVTRISIDDLRDLMVVRTAMETRALNRAAEHLRPETYKKLAKTERQLLQEENASAWLELDRTWHQTLYAASGNVTLCDMIASLRVNIERFMNVYGTIHPRRETATREHIAIREALMAQNSTFAEELLREHIFATLRNLERFISNASKTVEDTDAGEETG